MGAKRVFHGTLFLFLFYTQPPCAGVVIFFVFCNRTSDDTTPKPETTVFVEPPYRDQIGLQVELHAHQGMTAQIIEIERVLRLLPSCITGDSNDVRYPA